MPQTTTAVPLRRLIGGVLLSALSLYGGDTGVLSGEKSAVLTHRSDEIDAGAEALRYNWIAPLDLSASYTEQRPAGSDRWNGVFQAGASISQDVFRSGGIYYAIRYADDKQGYDRLGWLQERDALFAEVFTQVLTIRKYTLQCEQSELLQENHDITVYIKKHQYEAGEIDITLLNDAIMARNSERKNYQKLLQSLADARLELKKYTDAEAEAIVLPEFAVVDQETYLKRNYALNLAGRQSDVAYATYRVSQSAYLPKVSLNAKALYTDYTDAPATASAADGTSYSVGASVNLPLYYNGSATVQEQRSLMLRRKAEAADARRQEAIGYEQIQHLIARYRGENAMLEENMALYDTLIDVTQKGYEAGYKTGYDLQMLKNTKKSDELEIAVNMINIQLELVTLHQSVNMQEGE